MWDTVHGRQSNNIQKPRFTTPAFVLPRRVEHVVDKDSVAAGGVIYEDVSDRANQLSVLDDRTAAHSLDDASRFLKQILIRDFDEKATIIVRVVVYLLYHNRVLT